MKFSTREDMDLPIEVVFEGISNFKSFERKALRRGAEVNRTDPEAGQGLGTVWELSFQFRGKKRETIAEVSRFDVPEHLAVTYKSGGMIGAVNVSLVSLSKQKTRMMVALELAPTNLSSRLLVQSLKLAKGSLTKRFKGAVNDFATTLERDRGQPKMRPGKVAAS